MQVEYRHPNLFVFKREGNNRIVERIPLEEFRPYFFVSSNEEIPINPKILKVELGKKSLFGEETVKIICESPSDVAQLRNLFYKHFEADIKFHDRYLIDRIKEIPPENLRVCYFDIETNGFPDIVRSDKPITAICCYDNYTQKYYSFVLGQGTKKENVKYFDREEDLLSSFIEHVRNFDYDVLTAHNSDRFDLPVLLGRMINLSLNFSRMSPIGVVKREQWKGEWRCKIGGRILFDFLGSKTQYGTKGGIRGLLDGRDIDGNLVGMPERVFRVKRWSLDYLSSLVGMKKGSFKDCDTVDKLVEYNKTDVEIMVALDKKFNVIEYYHNLQMVVGCSFEQTYFNSSLIDMFLLRRCSQYAFPTRNHIKSENDESIRGALVDEAVPGLYPLMYVIDNTSLYPTIVVSANLSPETQSINGTIDYGNGLKFLSEPEGVISSAVKMLLELRIGYKKLSKEEKDPQKSQMYKLLSDGYKILLVSFYGVLLYESFRLYNRAVAETIPYAGRIIKEHVRKICLESGYKIVGGDTDSTFLIPSEGSVPIEKLVEKINNSFNNFSEDRGIKKHFFGIELDKTYEPVLIGDSKKRYVGFIKKGDKKIYKVTGYESTRRDTPELTEKMQETLFKMLLNGKNRKELETYINDLKKDIVEGKYSLTEIMIRKGFSKKFNTYKVDTPHVRGATYSNEHLGTHFDEYSDLGVIYIKRCPDGFPPTDVIAIDEETKDIIRDFAIDWDTMIEKVVSTKATNILKILGWDSDTNQKSLFDFEE